jgi:hypothetical protein
VPEADKTSESTAAAEIRVLLFMKASNLRFEIHLRYPKTMGHLTAVFKRQAAEVQVFLDLPSNAVFRRAFAEQGYNLVPGFVTTWEQPGERDGRAIPWHTTIRAAD